MAYIHTRITNVNDKSYHWSFLLFKVSSALPRLKPKLNDGARASRTYYIFSYQQSTNIVYHITLL